MRSQPSMPIFPLTMPSWGVKQEYWLRRLTGALMSRRRGTRLPILIYHRVHAVKDEMSPDEVDSLTFDWQMQCLRNYFCVLPLGVATHLLRRGELPQGAVAVTFDDGYRDNAEVALPILSRHGISATFFIATGFLGDGIMFNDMVIESLRRTALSHMDLRSLGFGAYDLTSMVSRRAAAQHILPQLKYMDWRMRAQTARQIAELARVELPSGLMMTPEQVRSLHRAGMTIGAHTVNHPILARMHADDAAREIEGSKRALEALTDAPVTLFAYPNGRPGVDYGTQDVSIVRRLGFAGAVSTAPGAASCVTDIYQMPRFMPWDRTPTRFVARLVKNTFTKNAIQV
jgi:peptidoglycan/xylan/chitin deacetylase (PgdA/CDA1 family)